MSLNIIAYVRGVFTSQQTMESFEKIVDGF